MDLSKVCRVCLITDVKMYDLRQHPLDHYTKSIEVFETLRDLPPYACFECAAMIKNTYFFTEKCVRSQTALCDVIDSVGPITESNVRHINRFDLNLVSRLSCHSISADSIINVKYEELDTPAVKVELYNEDVSYNEAKVFLELEVNTDIKHETSGDENDEISFCSESNKNQQEIKSKTLKKEKKIVKSKSLRKVKTSINKEVKPGPSKEPPRKAVRKRARRTTGEKAKGLAYSAARGWDDDFKLKEHFTIVVLSKEEQLKEMEKRKASPSYLKADFKCELCHKGFPDQGAARKHQRLRHDTEAGDIECEICKYRFKFKCQLTHHARIHTTRYACKMCPSTFVASAPAKEHYQRHRGVKYQCKHCGEIAETSKAFLNHMRLKHPSEFVCGECGHSFVTHRGLAVHKTLAHKGEDKPEVAESGEGQHCAECDVKFATQEAYQRHLDSSAKHNPLLKSNTSGGHTRAERRRETRRRRETKPTVREPRWSTVLGRAFPGPCDRCPEVVDSARAYWAHFRRAHPGQEYPVQGKHVCEVCGKFFQFLSSLTYHTRTHTSQRPFQCPRCPKAFPDPGKLSVHKLSHSDERTFACTLCDKTYKRRGELEKHLKYSAQHGGLRPHKCELCDKAFSESANLRVHVRTVHLKEPYPKRVRKQKKEDFLLAPSPP